ncbi:MAG: hypothetical protein ACI4KM_08545 [Oscillospiraceae bacterium]
MKKRYVAALCALSLLLTGCNNSASESVGESSPQTESVAAATGEITDETAAADNVESTPEPVGTPVTLTPISAAEKLELPISPGSISNVNDGRMLVINSTEDMKAALIDLNALTYVVTDIKVDKSNENEEFGYYFSPVFIGGYPAIVDIFSGEVRLMDDELNVIDTFKPGLDNAYLSDCWDKDMVCINTYGSDELIVVSAENGKLSHQMLRMNSGIDYLQSVIFINEKESIISSYDSENYTTDYYMLDSEKGEKTALNVSSDECAYYSDGKIYLFNYLENEITIFDPERPAIKSYFSFPREAWIVGGIKNGSIMYSAEDSEKVTLSRISLETGVTDATLEIRKESGEWATIWNTAESGEYIYILGCFNGENAILRWKPEPSSEEIPWQALVKPDYRRLTVEIANEIESEYGISVLYGNEAVRYFNDYAVVSETDERKICNALTALKTVFGKFPEGFLRELTSYKPIEVLLTGDILSSGQSRNSITTADAFTSSLDDKEVVVIDVGIYTMMETIAHEFFHVMEDTMYSVMQSNPEESYEVFWSWNYLNKPDFEYAFIYTHEDGSTIDDYSPDYGAYYYEGCGVDLNDIYFVDGYSTTFPSEDRARLFQKMLVLTDDMPEYFKGENINNKAAYLCLCLRDCFRSLDNCEDIVWERGIRIEHDLDWYREQYSWEKYAVG